MKKNMVLSSISIIQLLFLKCIICFQDKYVSLSIAKNRINKIYYLCIIVPKSIRYIRVAVCEKIYFLNLCFLIQFLFILIS